MTTHIFVLILSGHGQNDLTDFKALDQNHLIRGGGLEDRTVLVPLNRDHHSRTDGVERVRTVIGRYSKLAGEGILRNYNTGHAILCKNFYLL